MIDNSTEEIFRIGKNLLTKEQKCGMINKNGYVESDEVRRKLGRMPFRRSNTLRFYAVCIKGLRMDDPSGESRF